MKKVTDQQLKNEVQKRVRKIWKIYKEVFITLSK